MGGLTKLLLVSAKHAATLELIAVALEAMAVALEHVANICGEEEGEEDEA
jgi:hypothetical protein